MALTHSILIIFSLKLDETFFLLSLLLSIVFVPKTSGHMFGWFYGGPRKA